MTPLLKPLEAGERMPALFVGHGNPMSAIEPNRFSRAWSEAGKRIPRPQAVLSISAHWFIPETRVHGAQEPKTIHDFYGFPKELYAQTYPCPGAPAAAQELQRAVKSARVGWDTCWGVDHGTWIVTKRLFPKADVPVFQMSIDCSKPPAFHYALARELAFLRRRGVLILASGNLVHNLGMIDFEPAAKPYDWALEFESLAKDAIEKRDHAPLIACEDLGKSASLAVPTPDHYWPLLYVLGLQEEDERPEFFVEGIAHSSISMLSFRFG